MKRSENKTYHIQSINKHLVNILEENYYIELGNVDLHIIEAILIGQTVNFNQMFDYNILTKGIGKIIDETDDAHFQFNYLYELHQKSSSSKFVLTCGTIRYLDKTGVETYAPIVLIPLSLDYLNMEFVINSSPKINSVFIRLLKRNYRKEKDLLEQKKQEVVQEEAINSVTEQINNINNLIHNLDIIEETKLSSVYEIDMLCKRLSELTSLTIDTTNYLTVVEVEYPDYIDKKGLFGIQRSIYEMNDIELLNQYFLTTHGILTSNIEQKYITLKAHQGESFVVDGRLGSGKTQTVINIIGDFLFEAKRVLYVNHDLDNINDFRRKIKFLGLGSYLYDLTKNVSDIDNETELEVKKYGKFNFNKINDLASYRNIYDYKFHGYPYSYILEKIAIRKARQIQNNVVLEENLDREEVEYIYKALKQIEYELQFIDPLPDNVWGSLSSAKNAPDVSEIIERTNNLLEQTKKLLKLLSKIETKYHLEEIDSISNFHRLIEQMISFVSVRPILKWIETDFYEKSHQALAEINNDIDIHYSCTTFYKQHCPDDYLPGSISEAFKTIIHKHYDIKNAYSADCVYVNELLSSFDQLCALVDQIKKWVKDSINCYDLLKKYFNYDTPNRNQFILFNKLLSLLQTYEIDDVWFLEFVENPKEMIKKSITLSEEFKQLQTLRESLLPYLTFNELIFVNVEEIVNHKRFTRILKKHLNQPKIKQDGLSVNTICSRFKAYYEACLLIKNELPKQTSFNQFDEQIWNAYLNFLIFVSKLTSFETNSLVYLFKNGLNQKGGSKEQLISNLHRLRENQKELEIIEHHLGKYNIAVAGDNFLESVYFIKSNLNYLDKVINAIKKIQNSFIDSSNLKTTDILTLIEIDNQHLLVLDRMEKNSDRYEQLFGSAFKKFATLTSEITQSIERFMEFMKRFKTTDTITQQELLTVLLAEKPFTDFLDNIGLFTNSHSEWFSALRDFSTCFFGGKMGLQNSTFKEIIALLKVHVKKIDQVEHVYIIEHILDTFYRYKLEDLPKGIQSGKYATGIAEAYLYSTMCKYYHDMKEQGYIQFDLDVMKKTTIAFDEEESKYAETNLFNLRHHHHRFGNKQNKDLNAKVLANKSLPNNKGLFVSDVDVFNNIEDLSYFDLVIIDDAHLSTANKYANILNARQVIVFGDRMFQTSVTNTLMQRVKSSRVVPLRKRYIKMRNDFGNMWQVDNQFIYSPQLPLNISGYNSLEEMVIEVVKQFKLYKDTLDKRTFNIIVGSSVTRREVYRILINTLKQEYSTDEIVMIADDLIRIIAVNGESARIASEVYLWYDDIVMYDQMAKDLIKRNYITSSKKINLCYQLVKNPKQNEDMLQSINDFVGNHLVITNNTEGIAKIICEELTKKGIDIELGYGHLDLVIKTQAKNIGIMLYGKRINNSYSMVDDYLYFVKEYQRNGWEIKQYSMEAIAESLDNVLTDIINTVNKG